MEKRIESVEQSIANMEILFCELLARLDGGSKGCDDEIGDMEDCSRWIKRSTSTIYKYTSQKKIPHFRNGKRLLFKRSEVYAWLEKDRQPTMDDLKADIDNTLQHHAKSPWKPGIYK